MNELIPTFDFIAFFIAGVALIMGGALYAGLRAQALQVDKMRGLLASEASFRRQAEKDFSALLACSKNMGRQLRTQKFPAPTILPPSVDWTRVSDDSGGKDKVHRLIDKGLSVDEVATVCGLTQGEVEFLSRFTSAVRNHSVAA